MKTISNPMLVVLLKTGLERVVIFSGSVLVTLDNGEKDYSGRGRFELREGEEGYFLQGNCHEKILRRDKSKKITDNSSEIIIPLQNSGSCMLKVWPNSAYY